MRKETDKQPLRVVSRLRVKRFSLCWSETGKYTGPPAPIQMFCLSLESFNRRGGCNNLEGLCLTKSALQLLRECLVMTVECTQPFLQ